MRITLSEAEASTLLRLLEKERAKARREWLSNTSSLSAASHLIDVSSLIEKLEAHRG